MTRLRWLGVGAAFFLLLLVIAAMALGCGGEDRKDASKAEDLASWEKSGLGEGDEEAAVSRTEKGGEDAFVPQELPASSGPASTLPQLQLLVIKTALMEMEAGRGDYARIREDAVAIASAAGGYVEGESSRRDDEGLTYATLTLRVPADRFDAVVGEVSSLGEVVSTQVSTHDVSAEYVDLEGRLRHLQAEEAFYLSLIARAQTIQEMITIREHLDAIQLEKEQAQGRKDYLDQQVGFSTLTLSVHEVEPEGEGKGFWHSAGEAFKSFGRGLKALAVGFFYALPYLVVLAAIAVIVWLLIRRSRRRIPPEQPGNVG